MNNASEKSVASYKARNSTIFLILSEALADVLANHRHTLSHFQFKTEAR